MSRQEQTGSLTVVGTGITAIAHLTAEAIGHLREADVVVHNLYGAAALHIASLNSNCIGLQPLYGPETPRTETYVRMAEVIVREIRAGKRVVAAFHGHPSVLNAPARRALSIAAAEGAPARMLPGVSSVDTLLADLNLSLDSHGCQIVSAGTLLLHRMPIVVENHLIVMMPHAVGLTTGRAPTGPRQAKAHLLFERLAEIYGGEHPCIVYSGARAPTDPTIILHRTLGACIDPEALDDLPDVWTLYVPPLTFPDVDLAMAGRMDLTAVVMSNGPRPSKGGGYGPFEKMALERLDEADLDTAGPDPNPLLLKIMTKLVESPRFADATPWLKGGGRTDGSS